MSRVQPLNIFQCIQIKCKHLVIGELGTKGCGLEKCPHNKNFATYKINGCPVPKACKNKTLFMATDAPNRRCTECYPIDMCQKAWQPK